MGLDDPAGPPGATIRHLLAHASGLAFDDETVISPPGRTRIYSNTGFDALAAAVERAAGRSFAQLMRAWVLDPLGMDRRRASPGRPSGGLAGHAPGPRPPSPASCCEPRLLPRETLADGDDSRVPRPARRAARVRAAGSARLGPRLRAPGREGAALDGRPELAADVRAVRRQRHVPVGGPGRGPRARGLTDRQFGPWAAMRLARGSADAVARGCRVSRPPRLPAPGAGLALDRPRDPRRHPAAVEAARLRRRRARRRPTPRPPSRRRRQGGRGSPRTPGSWPLVRPGRRPSIRRDPASSDQYVASPFHSQWLEPVDGRSSVRAHVLARDVVDRCPGGLEDPQRAGRVRDDDPVDDDADPLGHRLDARWSRVVPDGLLAGPGDDGIDAAGDAARRSGGRCRRSSARSSAAGLAPGFVRRQPADAAAHSGTRPRPRGATGPPGSRGPRAWPPPARPRLAPRRSPRSDGSRCSGDGRGPPPAGRGTPRGRPPRGRGARYRAPRARRASGTRSTAWWPDRARGSARQLRAGDVAVAARQDLDQDPSLRRPAEPARMETVADVLPPGVARGVASGRMRQADPIGVHRAEG